MSKLSAVQKEMLIAISECSDLKSARSLCQTFLQETENIIPDEPRCIEDLITGLLHKIPYSVEQMQTLCHTYTGQSSPKFLLWILSKGDNEMRQAASQIPGTWCVLYQGRLVGLSSGPDPAPAIKQLEGKYKLAGGMSRPFSNLIDFHVFYNQALITLHTALVLGRTGLAFYDDFLMLRLFDGLREDIDVNDFSLPDIQVLRDYDKKHSADLCQTLLCYLESSKNVNITAKKLNVHRNTVHYRIGKCQEMLPMLKFDEGYVYLLMLSLYIVQYGLYREKSGI